MKILCQILLTLVFLVSVQKSTEADNITNSPKNRLDVNNISSDFTMTGIFDANPSRTGGFEWPKNSRKTAVFCAGLTLAAYVNNIFLMAAASYKGEYAPGYVYHLNGNPIVATDNRFRFYKITRGDNINSNPDWINWINMIPFGAPFKDVNNNGIYEPAIDTPGVKGADQTIFICLTDGFPEEHKIGEGFGGGTSPMFAEVHLTAWAYNRPGLEDIQFIKWDVINKNTKTWNRMYSSIVCDPDLGFANDDYIGCDTLRDLVYCYNADNNDSGSANSYGVNPPAVGFKWLNCSGINNIGVTSSVYMSNSLSDPYCEQIPSGEPLNAYNLMRGLKKDLTPWVIPPGGSPQYITKYCYSGNPETGTGWNEGIPGSPSGSVRNCGGQNILSGDITPVNPPGDRFFIMNSGSENNNINSNDTIKILIAQLIARGTSSLNSVTKLKQLSDVAQNLCNNGFIIGVNNISSEVPNSFKLYQNYPNPFNPVTKIKFTIPHTPLSFGEGPGVRLVIYDVLGREVASLIPPLRGGEEGFQPGTYEADWDAANYPSGVYFYKLMVIDASAPLSTIFSETKKMVLMK